MLTVKLVITLQAAEKHNATSSSRNNIRLSKGSLYTSVTTAHGRDTSQHGTQSAESSNTL